MRTSSHPSNLRLIRSSDIDANVRFEDLFLHHLDALYRTALRLTKNKSDAEDLLQETLLRALKNFDQLQDRSKARASLFQILVNTFYNIQNKQKRGVPIVDVELTEDLVASSLEAPQYNPLEVFARLMSDEVERALDGLHPAFKVVLLLHDVEGLSYDEIAEACRCSKGTVASRLYRAREILRTNLEAFARAHGYL
jgi:RNA polymerase sigma-70 factor (ECF subfamily)